MRIIKIHISPVFVQATLGPTCGLCPRFLTHYHANEQGMVNQVTKDSPALLSILNKAIALIFPDLRSIYLTVKVKDILFDGVEIDCRGTDFPAKAVCTQLKSQVSGLKMSSEKNVFLFSILGMRNATQGKTVKVKRGISNYKDLGRLLEVDGRKQLALWSTAECNRFRGTDGWIFPPLIKEDDEIWTFSTDLCRNIQAKFVKKAIYKGIYVFRYEANLGDMEHRPEEKCYCATPKTCLRKGVFDLTKCMGVPIYATLPHFLETDEIYLKQVHGLNPVMEEHVVKIYFEPLTATPIEAKKRMQFNLPISPSNKISLMKTIPEALHPIFWIEEGVELEGPLFKKIADIFLLISVLKILRWVVLFIGIICLLYGIYSYFKNKQIVRITPAHRIERSLKPGYANRKSTSGRVKNANFINMNSILSRHEFDKY